MSVCVKYCMYVCSACGMAHPFVVLAGHVGSENALHGESRCLLALESCFLHVHALVLLDDDGCTCPAHEFGQPAERHRHTEKQEVSSASM